MPTCVDVTLAIGSMGCGVLSHTAPWENSQVSAVLLLLASCSADPWLSLRPLPGDPAGCLEPPQQPPVHEPPLQVPVQILFDPDVDRAAAIERASLAASLWASFGVELRLEGATERDLEPPLAGDAPSIDAATEGLPEAEAAALMQREILSPARSLLLSEAIPARHALILVFPERLAAPSSPAERLAGEIAGLTLSPALLRAQPDGAEILRALDLGVPFTPTIFLGPGALAQDRRWVAAHEIGHALGLPHDSEPRNLMEQPPARCRPSLRPDQLRALALP